MMGFEFLGGKQIAIALDALGAEGNVRLPTIPMANPAVCCVRSALPQREKFSEIIIDSAS